MMLGCGGTIAFVGAGITGTSAAIFASAKGIPSGVEPFLSDIPWWLGALVLTVLTYVFAAPMARAARAQRDWKEKWPSIYFCECETCGYHFVHNPGNPQPVTVRPQLLAAAEARRAEQERNMKAALALDAWIKNHRD